MSTLKVDAIRHNSATSDAITTHSDGTCTAKITGMTGGGGLSHRNLIVNGAMNVAQRGQVTGIGHASGGAGAGFGGPDRFQFNSNYSIVTMSQSTDVPSGQGFAKSLKLDVTTAGGDSNADTYTQLDYRFEGQELTRLKYGTSNAETTTLCFWIKSPKAGTHWVRLYGDELSHSGGGAAFISRKYTVSSANTWQKVTLNFPGFTTDGFDNDNTLGMRISIYFAQGSAYSSGTAQADDGGWLNWGDANDRARNTVGQVNCFDSTSNDIFITGVQFEVGDTATTFEHKKFSDELRDCQRYFQKSYNYDDAVGSSGVQGWFQWRRDGGNRPHIPMMTSMRSTPTFMAYNYVGGTGGQFRNASNGTNHAQGSVNVIGQNIVSFDAGATGWNQIGTGEVGFMYYSLESEL